jgi:flagellar biosynthesis anti-sigma factor FlgM
MVRDISGLGGPPDTSTANRGSKAVDSTKSAAEPATKVVAQQDDVELSEQAKQLTALTDKVSALADVDESRVAEVKAALERNEFKIDNHRLADKILAADNQF